MRRIIFWLCLCSLLLSGCGGGSDQMRDAALPKQGALRMGGTAPVSAAAYQAAVQQIYVAYFGRPADAAGLAYYEQLLANFNAPQSIPELAAAYGANGNIRLVIDSFGNSQESQALYGGDTATFVKAVYRNLFNRAPDSAGLAYWTKMIDSGAVTRAIAAMSIMAGSQGTDGEIISRKTDVANQFTTSLNNDAKTKAYSGLSANAVVRSMLSQVSNTVDAANFQSAIDSTILSLAPTSLSGKMVLGGPVVGAQISAYRLDVNQRAQLIATATTDSQGKFVMDMAGKSGAVLFETNGGSFINEADGSKLSVEGTNRALLLEIKGARQVAITPITSRMVVMDQIWVRLEGYSAMLAQAKKNLGFDPLTVWPANLTELLGPEVTPEEKTYGSIIGGISQDLIGRSSVRDLSADFGISQNSNLASYDSADKFANNPRNISGWPTPSRIVLPNPAYDAAFASKSWNELWNGTWSCPAKTTINVDACNLPGASPKCNSHLTTHDFSVTLKAGMWCVPDTAVTPWQADPTTTTATGFGCRTEGSYGESKTGWCVPYMSENGLYIIQAFRATYTPPADAPTSLKSGDANLVCPQIQPNPSAYPLFLQGNWCLAPGGIYPWLAKNNRCENGGTFQNGWCGLFSKENGQFVTATVPIDPTVPAPFDAADKDRFDFVSYTYTCPADQYHPSSYSQTTRVFGGPKSPFTASSPCLGAAKQLEAATCNTSSTAGELAYAKADLAYLQCLTNNSTEPYKSAYQSGLQDKQDLVDFWQKKCPAPKVSRNGVCVDPPPPPSTPTPGTPASTSACLNSYVGPDDDPQTDQYCKMSSFDQCMRKATGDKSFDIDGRGACSVLKGLLESLGATKTYSCQYCPYPY